MSNRFFTNTQDLLPNALARATAVEANLTSVEAGFDAAQVELNAAVRAPDGETLSRLPAAASRANKGLSFDGSGNPTAVTLASQSEMAAAVQAAADAQAALTTFSGTYYGALAADPSVDPNGSACTTGDIYFNTSTQKLKVYNGSSWINGLDTSTGVVPDTRSISAGSGLTGGGNLQADRTISVASNGITDAMLRTGAATSVIGRAGGTTGNVADIAATVDGQFLRRVAGALTFSALASGDITGALGFTPGNAGGQTWTGTHSFTTLQVSGNAVWHAGNFTPANKADLASPTFTGTPAAPTAAPGTNTTQIATTAFVTAAVGGSGFVPTARTITPADSSLTGGGDLSANRTLAFSTTWGDARYLTLTGGTLTAVLITSTPGAGGAGLRLPHGSAPSAPVNGDIWTTTTSIVARLNGTSRGIWHEGNLTPANYAPLASPNFSGTPQISGVNIATQTYVTSQGYITSSALTPYAPLASPTFTGVPAAPTAAADTNTTQVATTAFVIGQGYLKSSTAASTYAALSGATFTGDITTYRAGAPTTGVIYLGNSGVRYLYYDGSSYVMPGAELSVNGSNVWRTATLTNLNQLTNGPGYITTPIGSWTGNMTITGSSGIALTLNAAGANVGLYVVGGTGQDVATFQGGSGQDAIVKIIGSGTTNAYLMMQNGTSGERVRMWANNSRELSLSMDSGTTAHATFRSTGRLHLGDTGGNGLRKVTVQSGGSPPTGAQGDVCFIY